MSGRRGTSRAIADAMLALVRRASVTIAGDDHRFDVTIGEVTIMFDDAAVHPFERLASAIEARIAFDRATAMIAAAGETGAPLWLVVAPDMLAKWLTWSRTEKALAKTLALSDQPGMAPVAGDLVRRARQNLGHMAATIRVRGGQAVAERIQLSQRVRAGAALGNRALIRVGRNQLPETIVVSLEREQGSNACRRASEIFDHPFFARNDFVIAGVSNEGGDIVVELETSWQPLRPVPKAAWSVVPPTANPLFPWRATEGELAELYALVAQGEALLQERH